MAWTCKDCGQSFGKKADHGDIEAAHAELAKRAVEEAGEPEIMSYPEGYDSSILSDVNVPVVTESGTTYGLILPDLIIGGGETGTSIDIAVTANIDDGWSHNQSEVRDILADFEAGAADFTIEQWVEIIRLIKEQGCGCACDISSGNIAVGDVMFSDDRKYGRIDHDCPKCGERAMQCKQRYLAYQCNECGTAHTWDGSNKKFGFPGAAF